MRRYGLWAVRAAVVAFILGSLMACAADGANPGTSPTPNQGSSSQDPSSATAQSTSTASPADPAPTDAAKPTAATASATPPPNYVKNATWVENDKGWTLQVVPTKAARQAVASYQAGVDGFDQLEARFPSTRLVEHRESLRNQYICHQQFATLAEPDKPTWDLEAWRPNVPYLDVVAAECNPGGPE